MQYDKTMGFDFVKLHICYACLLLFVVDEMSFNILHLIYPFVLREWQPIGRMTEILRFDVQTPALYRVE